ncbi:ArsR/SmtB family transcription factor [candidate division CSSED10-310 bacterium]|uniref:ArsR/SmtB family transcription factor n=1 Tax=candidate division CSSED10-310 bacterium TaxID=2855610 RepID=A0ABV6YXE1_UNCC1
MRDFIKVMKALSDKNRVKIIKMLQFKELCVCEIKAGLSIAQPTVSKHLKVLEDAGLVSYRKDGTWVNYFLCVGSSNPYAAELLKNLRSWMDNDPEVVSILEKLPGIDREIVCNQ